MNKKRPGLAHFLKKDKSSSKNQFSGFEALNELPIDDSVLTYHG